MTLPNITTYHIKTFWSHQDDAWIATYVGPMQELSRLSAFGPDPRTAINELFTAINLALEVLSEEEDDQHS